eukprot:462803_1
MYQYRNLPPRHQPPGFYPPHQPSLRRHQQPQPHQQYDYSHNTPLTRSHSHGFLHGHPPNNQNGYRTHHIISPIHSPPHSHSPLHNHSPPHTHSPPHNNKRNNHNNNTNNNNSNINTNPNALYAIQQVQRIKAATACQIINNRVVE